MTLFKSLLGLGTVFAISSSWLYFLSRQFDNQNSEIHFPRDLEDLKNMSKILRAYQQEHYNLVIVLFCSAYLYKQTFAIPGSVFTNILGGALFGTWVAFPLVCCLTAVGATCCYLLSKCFGRQLLIKKFPDRIASLQQRVMENEDSLFYFLLSARLFPISPNWFLNMSSPIIGIPLQPFFMSVLFGLIPYNFICVQTGSILSSVSSMEDVFSASTLFGMLVVALFALLPGILFRHKHSQHAKV